MTNKKNHDLDSFTNLNHIKIPNYITLIKKILVIFFSTSLIILIITPWQQTTKGFGYIIANNPNDRTQDINSPITGRIKKNL